MPVLCTPFLFPPWAEVRKEQDSCLLITCPLSLQLALLGEPWELESSQRDGPRASQMSKEA